MKKGTYLKTISFLLFFFFLILIYLWIYVFPSIRKVNMLKREIKQYTLKIENAKIEKTIFIKGDKKEDLLFAECDSEFAKRLKEWQNDKIAFNRTIRNAGEKAGVSRLKISTETDENLLSVTPEGKVVKQNKINLDFIAGLRYGAEFIRVLPLSGQYLLISDVNAVRSGVYYKFIVNTRQLFAGEVKTDREQQHDNKKVNFIDMNSPLLKRPVYLTPLKIRKKAGEPGNPGK